MKTHQGFSPEPSPGLGADDGPIARVRGELKAPAGIQSNALGLGRAIGREGFPLSTRRTDRLDAGAIPGTVPGCIASSSGGYGGVGQKARCLRHDPCGYVPENVLFKAGEVFPIDFEDCGYGHWIWDIGVALGYWPWSEDWYWIRDAFLEGYAQARILPASQLVHLDLFMAAQYATMVLWASMSIKNDPAMRAEYEEWRNREGNKLLHYFESH
jgi:hypothetical protein